MKNSFFFPVQNSTFAPSVDALYYFIFWLSTFFFVLIIGMMLYFMVKYRRVNGVEPEKSPSHNTVIEVTWSVVPGILVLGIFAWGFISYMDMRSPPAETYDIHVTARTWSWNFKYPNGAMDGHLHIPVGEPVKLIMRSEDVIHSAFIPAFRVKQDIVPGRYSGLWFQAVEKGEHDFYCAEYCGKQHSDMLAKVYVHETDPAKLTEAGEQTFAQWAEDARDPTKNVTPEQAGEKIIAMFGCLQCHSVDGSQKVGPSLKGFYGKEVQIAGQNPVLVDPEYIRESLLEPNAKIRQGFKGEMPSFKGQMKDEWIDCVIAYIKSIQ